jgi:hypothetical protein
MATTARTVRNSSLIGGIHHSIGRKRRRREKETSLWSSHDQQKMGGVPIFLIAIIPGRDLAEPAVFKSQIANEAPLSEIVFPFLNRYIFLQQRRRAHDLKLRTDGREKVSSDPHFFPDFHMDWLSALSKNVIFIVTDGDKL